MMFHDQESFARGVQLKRFLFFIFLVNEGSEYSNTTKSGPSWACPEAPSKWRITGVPMKAQH